MYMARIGKWGIGKNIKGQQMEAVIRKEVERARAGKKSVFLWHGSRVPSHRVVRYRRKMKLLSDVGALKLGAPTPPGLICHTPLPSPLTTPRVLEIPERIARLCQEYVDGSFGSHTWVSEGDEVYSTKGSSSADFRFDGACVTAWNDWTAGDTKQAWRMLGVATTLIEAVLLGELPRTLFSLGYWIYQWAFLLHEPAIAFTLLRHFSNMSATVLSPGHALTNICAYLAGMDMTHLRYALHICQQVQVDRFNQELGRFNPISIDAQRIILVSGNASNAAQDLLSFSQEVENALGPYHFRTLQTRVYSANTYLAQDMFDEAAEVAQSALVAADEENGGLVANCLETLAIAQYSTSKVDLALQSLRRGIQILVDDSGHEDRYLPGMLRRLWSWLEKLDRPQEAAEARRQHDELVEAKYYRLSREEEGRYQRLFEAKA